jgi:hypothetical protein
MMMMMMMMMIIIIIIIIIIIKKKILHLFVCYAQLKIVDNVCFEKMVLSLHNLTGMELFYMNHKICYCSSSQLHKVEAGLTFH